MARRFGLEIEFAGQPDRLIEELRREGLSSATRMHGYIGHSDSEWIVKRDGSVNNGGELVGPPLDFDDPEQRGQIARAVAAMQRAGCQPDDSAGIHVHVEATDLNARQVAAVGRSFAKYEDAIYRLASSGWQNIRRAAHTYAKPLSDEQRKGLSKAKTDEQLRTAWYGSGTSGFYNDRSSHAHSSRYCGLNIHSWFYRGTIEFRVFNSSINADRVSFYVSMSVAMVQDAREGRACSVGTAKRMGTMKSALQESEQAGKKAANSEFHSFSGFLRYRGGMSLEDIALFRRFWSDSVPQDRISA